MEDLNDKVTGGSLSASEWNQVPSEIQNVIESAGIVLSSGDVSQLLKAVSDISRYGKFFTDSGAADAYVATAFGQAATAYFDGMEIIFVPDNANTGASTIDVDGLGAKDIKKAYGSTADPSAAQLSGLVKLTYDGTNFGISGRTLPLENSSFVEAWNVAGSVSLPLLGIDSSEDAIVGNFTSRLEIRGGSDTFIKTGSDLFAFAATDTGSARLFEGGVEHISTETTNTSSDLSGGSVRDNLGTTRAIGFNLLPVILVTGTSNDTFDRQSAGYMFEVTGTGVQTLTIDTDANTPVNTVWMAANNSGDSSSMSIAVGANTLTWMNPGGVSTGARSVQVGGVVTVWKTGANDYKIWGSGIS